MSELLLEVEDLGVSLPTSSGQLHAVDGLGFSLREGELLGIVGESGSGKTQTALALMGLTPAGSRVSGSARLDGEELIGRPEAELNDLRGDRIAMVFQDPQAALNPYLRIGVQLTEVLEQHRELDAVTAAQRATEMLQAVGLDDSERCMRSYPHQLSGGMRQRVTIAIALLCRPRLLIADEPTTALDVTVQAQILGLLRVLKGSHYGAGLLITHDLAVVAEICDRVLVMYGGKPMELAAVDRLFHNGHHPYTRALLRSLPRLDRPESGLVPIPGQPGRPTGAGCPFRPRCAERLEQCAAVVPPRLDIAPGHLSYCHRSGPN
ncbi:MAG: ABC transporter ATP-binding protein [Chromatiales bacterium]|nr:ABC transporter ATP-binding protein [Chromatiales bacterium]